MSLVAPSPRAPSAVLRWREIEGPPPDLVELCDALRVEACPWLLDSALEDARLGRFSFVGADPPLVMRLRGDVVELHGRRPAFPGLDAGFRSIEGDPFETLRECLPRVGAIVDGPPDLPFVGGAVGFLGYELGAFSEPRVTSSHDDGSSFPDAVLLLVDRLIAVDHVARRGYVLGWGFGTTHREAGRRADESLAVVRGWLDDASRRTGAAAPPAPARPDLARRRELLAAEVPRAVERSLEPAAHAARVEEIVREIEAGNVYEANLTERLSLPFDGDAFGLYRALRRESPSPFAGFVELPEGAILSSSPERFLRLTEDGAVESRPIKGTRPRGRAAEEDAALAAALEGSEKDRAENLMIVDLVRNDLGRVCTTGSVAVPELMAIERYAAVFQMVSSVTGRLRDDCDAVDLLRATFPPGSMTGAPKIAAMRLIDRVETVRRGVYSGALGYFDVRGGFDLSVVIRTILVEKGRALWHVGGAIVADSTPAAERAECLDKARPMLAALASVADAVLPASCLPRSALSDH